MSVAEPLIIQASAVALDGRALAIIGAPGSGKSTLALALIDRGAVLIGDDAITLSRRGDTVWASPPPNITGLIEVRGIGLVTLPVSPAVPLALVLDLDGHPERQPERRPERLPEIVPSREMLGLAIPCLTFEPGTIAPALRAQWALVCHGLSCG